MNKLHPMECSECGVQAMKASAGARYPAPCAECGDVTTWERLTPQ